MTLGDGRQKCQFDHECEYSRFTSLNKKPPKNSKQWGFSPLLVNFSYHLANYVLQYEGKIHLVSEVREKRSHCLGCVPLAKSNQAGE